MSGVQLDQNSDAKKLARRCNDEGSIECHRFPPELRDEPDDSVLLHAKDCWRVLLTYDRTIIDEFWQQVVDGSPGVVIIAEDDHTQFVRQMTFKSATKILATFKQEFPQWHRVSWENSVVEIKPSFIAVNHVDATGVSRTGFLDRRKSGWQAELQDLLELNASRN